MSNHDNKKIIPTTKLRNFYGLLRILSTKTQKAILDDFSRGNNCSKLKDIFYESRDHFAHYSNITEPFISGIKRKKLPKGFKNISNTNHVTSILEKNKINMVSSNSNYDFIYLNREVSTIRTSKSEFDTGVSAKSSGLGGLDFIGVTSQKNNPILGEIKVNNDEDPFFALIQLLTYLSELTTDNQIERINKTKLFKVNIRKNNKFYLFILFYHNTKLKKGWHDIYNKTKILSEKLTQSIKEIEEIIFLNMGENAAHFEIKEYKN